LRDLVALSHLRHEPVLESAVHHESVPMPVRLLAIALEAPPRFEDLTRDPPLMPAPARTHTRSHTHTCTHTAPGRDMAKA
jgi:hypothetical protein